MPDRLPEKSTLRSRCAECGQTTRVGEFHPFAFCALKKAGLDPWQEIRIITGQLGLDDPGEAPPLITQTVSPVNFR